MLNLNREKKEKKISETKSIKSCFLTGPKGDGNVNKNPLDKMPQ